MRLKTKVRLKIFIFTILFCSILVTILMHKDVNGAAGGRQEARGKAGRRVASINVDDFGTQKKDDRNSINSFLFTNSAATVKDFLDTPPSVKTFRVDTNCDTNPRTCDNNNKNNNNINNNINNNNIDSNIKNNNNINNNSNNINNINNNLNNNSRVTTRRSSNLKTQGTLATRAPFNKSPLLKQMLKLYLETPPQKRGSINAILDYFRSIDSDIQLNTLMTLLDKEITSRRTGSQGRRPSLPPLSPFKVFQDLPRPPQERVAVKKERVTSRTRLGKGYSSRVLIESVAMPDSWQPPANLSKRYEQRKAHVKKVCHAHSLSERTPTHQPNAWEFFVSPPFGLVWCNVFKAASSTWIYNFNLLAGYTEAFLLNNKDTPIALARRKYPRVSVSELDEAMNASSRSIAFMIARHPLERLVSAYRDKLQSGNRFYRKLSQKIMSRYSKLGPNLPLLAVPRGPQLKGGLVRGQAPSFRQFVQFILDSHAKGLPLDEHWSPMDKFCSPCLVDFDVFAKVETLEEDGNYIIYKSGIRPLIKPKRINRSKNEPTSQVASSYLCQVSHSQMDGLISLYKMDLELFQYKYDQYLNCTQPD